MKEIWKDIKDYEDYYQISNLGNVRSKTHIRKNGKDEKHICVSNGKILNPGKDSNGYSVVVFSKNGKTKSYRIHRLVAQTFIPNPNNYRCVNHKDENKQNNNLNNLEWCNHIYNNNYGTKKERLKLSQQKRVGKKVNQYDLKGNFIRQWNCIMEAERYLKRKRANVNICACCRNKQKTAFGYIWRYGE